jgi:hypothetical protein
MLNYSVVSALSSANMQYQCKHRYVIVAESQILCAVVSQCSSFMPVQYAETLHTVDFTSGNMAVRFKPLKRTLGKLITSNLANLSLSAARFFSISAAKAAPETIPTSTSRTVVH